MNSPKRIPFLDTAKAISIISVVLMHSLMNNSDMLKVTHVNLVNWLNLYCVMVFFFINGFLYKDVAAKAPFKSALSKIKSYYLPYLKYNLFFFIFHDLFIDCHFISGSKYFISPKFFCLEFIQYLLGKVQSLGGPLWFLRALIIISIIYLLCDSFSSRIFNGRLRYAINLVVSIVLLLAAINGLIPGTFNAKEACRYIIFYTLGTIYRHYELNKYVSRFAILISIITFILTTVIANATNVGIKPSSNYLLFYIASLLATLQIIAFSQIKYISDFKPLVFLGKYTMQILALHFLAFKPVSFIIIKLYGLEINYLSGVPVIKDANISDLFFIPYTIAGITLPVIYTLFIQHIKKVYSRSQK